MAAISSLAEFATAVAMETAQWTKLLTELGNPTDLDELVCIPKDILIKCVSDFEFVEGDDTKKMSPVQVGRFAKNYDIINMKVSKDPPTAGPEPPSGGKKPDTAKTDISETAVKLAHIINETLDGYVIRPKNEEYNRLLLIYVSSCGGLPRDEIEPTADQIGALLQVLTAGQAPYADFSLWGPRGKRALKKLIHSAALYDPNTGKWVQKNLRGPPSFETWLKSWNVFRVAMIMLGQASAAALDA